MICGPPCNIKITLIIIIIIIITTITLYSDKKEITEVLEKATSGVKRR